MLINRLFRVGLISLLLLLAPLSAMSQISPFEVKSANTQLNGNVFFLNAVFDISLPAYITSAVDQGFKLPILMEVEIYKQKNYWFDQRVIYIKQQYQLDYHPLLDRISVYDINSGSELFYSSLAEAIQKISVVLNFPMLDKNNLSENEAYKSRLRIGIDLEELPIPLKSSSLWENNWDLASDWYEWVVVE